MNLQRKTLFLKIFIFCYLTQITHNIKTAETFFLLNTRERAKMLSITKRVLQRRSSQEMTSKVVLYFTLI